MSTRNNKNVSQPVVTPANNLMVGIDIGYGWTKAVSNRPHYEKVQFPSVMASAADIHYGLEDMTKRYPGDQLTDGVKNWFIGNLALAQVNQNEIVRLRGRVGDSGISQEFRLNMFKAVIGKIMAGVKDGDAVNIRLITGLPVEHMRSGAKELRDMLQKPHKVLTDVADFTANVAEVIVIPQPYGSIFNRTLNTDGTVNAEHTDKVTAVIDIGQYTVDISVDNAGQPINHQSGSVEAGVHTAYRSLHNAINKRFNSVASDADIDTLIRTQVYRAYGKDHEMKEEVRDAMMTLRTATLNLMTDKIGNGASVDVIYVSGGGAALVAAHVAQAYPLNIVRVMPNAQLANAQGFYNYMRFLANKP